MAVLAGEGGALDWTIAVGSLVGGVGTFAVGLVAMRLATEQARGHLYPAPAVLADADSGGLVLHNFGTGVMLDVRVEMALVEPDGSRRSVTRSITTVLAGHCSSLVGSDALSQLAVMEVRGELRYRTAGGRYRRQRFHLSALSLSGLDGGP